MASVLLVCSWCGDKFQLRVAEFNRRTKLGKTRFFCCQSCASYHQSEGRENKRVPLAKKCPYCKKTFKTISGSKSPTYCSRRCASAGSVTTKRREAGGNNPGNINTIQVIADGLRSREWRKYVKLDAYLRRKKVAHAFEFPLPSTRCIFDLALVDLKILVEFDGPHHSSSRNRRTDQKKDSVAKRRGWRVVRVSDKKGKALSPRCLRKVLSKENT